VATVPILINKDNVGTISEIRKERHTLKAQTVGCTFNEN
jgi:hypothetical protein